MKEVFTLRRLHTNNGVRVIINCLILGLCNDGDSIVELINRQWDGSMVMNCLNISYNDLVRTVEISVEIRGMGVLL